MEVSVASIGCVIAIIVLVLLVAKDGWGIAFGAAENRYWHLLLVLIQGLGAMVIALFLFLILPQL